MLAMWLRNPILAGVVRPRPAARYHFAAKDVIISGVMSASSICPVPTNDDMIVSSKFFDLTEMDLGFSRITGWGRRG